MGGLQEGNQQTNIQLSLQKQKKLEEEKFKTAAATIYKL
jgi:hypothetical protein